VPEPTIWHHLALRRDPLEVPIIGEPNEFHFELLLPSG
jgi:hypothetical protein